LAVVLEDDCCWGKSTPGWEDPSMVHGAGAMNHGSASLISHKQWICLASQLFPLIIDLSSLRECILLASCFLSCINRYMTWDIPKMPVAK